MSNPDTSRRRSPRLRDPESHKVLCCHGYCMVEYKYASMAERSLAGRTRAEETNIVIFGKLGAKWTVANMALM